MSVGWIASLAEQILLVIFAVPVVKGGTPTKKKTLVGGRRKPLTRTHAVAGWLISLSSPTDNEPASPENWGFVDLVAFLPTGRIEDEVILHGVSEQFNAKSMRAWGPSRWIERCLGRLVRQRTMLLPLWANIRVCVGEGLPWPPQKLLTPDMTRTTPAGSPVLYATLSFCTLTTAPLTEKTL